MLEGEMEGMRQRIVHSDRDTGLVRECARQEGSRTIVIGLYVHMHLDWVGTEEMCHHFM